MTLTVWVIGTGDGPFVFKNVSEDRYESFKTAVMLREIKLLKFKTAEQDVYISAEYVTAFAVKNDKEEEQSKDAE